VVNLRVIPAQFWGGYACRCAKSECEMWSESLTADEVSFTKNAIESLKSTDWGASVVHRLEVAGGVKPENMPLMFEVRYAYELNRKGVTAQYEYGAGVGDSTVEFKISNGVTWLVELVSIRTSQAAKRAIKQTGLIYQQILASDSNDIAQTEEAEMITAEQKIGEKVFSDGKPTKFPMPQNNQYHVVLVDARGYLDGGGDIYDYRQMAYGASGIPRDSSWTVHYWKNQDGIPKPITGLFEAECPLKSAKHVHERIHFLGFISEESFVDGEIASNAYYLANPHLFSHAEAEAAYMHYPLRNETSA